MAQRSESRDEAEKKFHELDDAYEAAQPRMNELKLVKFNDLPMLSSVTTGLYEELDKLCKKAPGELVTELVLEEVNKLIKKIKDLPGADEHISSINEFVAAGDNPEQRDVLIILRFLKEGLKRIEQKVNLIIDSNKNTLHQIANLKDALAVYLLNDSPISNSLLMEEGIELDHSFFVKEDEEIVLDINRVISYEIPTFC